MINVYYGMSGAFKSTTIDYEIRKHFKSTFNRAFCLPSMIKYWKQIETSVFNGKMERNNLNFAILHLCNLKNFIEREVKIDLADNDLDHIMIERGITDMLFYQLQEHPEYINDTNWISSAVSEESRILCHPGLTINKILLIQKDRDFIESKVLSESSRREVFPDVDTYLKAQDDYVEFTTKFNWITDIREITNASEYLNKLL